ncbi:MAG: nickel transporter [Methylococcales bacterium]|nr:nickel transporter [Methylococcales bacterium]
MRLIPVLDLKDGVVVHAQRGQRDNYQPIHSPLCPSADVYDVIDAFLQLADFKIIYIADLNAVIQQGDNQALIYAVLQHYPSITFWLDAGYQSPDLAFAEVSNYRPVLGSECCTASQLAATKNALLSLDFSSDNQPLGELCLFADSQLWSEQVIIMTLARVGSDAGVDSEKLRYYQQTYPQTNFIAAGGVRHIADLQQLKTIGIKSVLVASALHTKAISKADIVNL